MVLSAAKSRARGGAASSRAARGGAAGARGGVRAAAGANPALAPRTSEMAGDPFGLLLSQRVVFLGGEVNDFSADAVISQLLLLDATDSSKDIRLFINSPGGSVTAGLGIYDAMQLVSCDVQTVCFGLAASMGAFILGAGAPGKRLATPNARVMIHQPLGGASGQAKDLEIQAKEIMYHKVNINRIMAGYTGRRSARSSWTRTATGTCPPWSPRSTASSTTSWAGRRRPSTWPGSWTTSPRRSRTTPRGGRRRRRTWAPAVATSPECPGSPTCEGGAAAW